MNSKFLSAAAGVALLMLASAANAAQPAPLSDSQMDGVTAGAIVSIPGGVALANAAAVALGEISGDTQTQTATNVNNTGSPLSWIAIGQSASQSVAIGGILFNAAAAAHSDSAATFPGI